MLAGTPGFQSPEQLKLENIHGRTDVFSLGGVLAEMFGQRPLWEGYTHYQIMYKLTVEGVHPPISHLPSEVQKICKSCFAEKIKKVNSVAALNKLLQLAKLWA